MMITTNKSVNKYEWVEDVWVSTDVKNEEKAKENDKNPIDLSAQNKVNDEKMNDNNK